MKLFLRMSIEKLEAAIDSLEAQLAEGISSVTNPVVGGGSYYTPAQAALVLEQLYDRLEERTGVTYRDKEGVVILNVSARRGAA